MTNSRGRFVAIGNFTSGKIHRQWRPMIGEVLEDTCHCFGGDGIASTLVEPTSDTIEVAVNDVGKKRTGYAVDSRVGGGKFLA